MVHIAFIFDLETQDLKVRSISETVLENMAQPFLKIIKGTFFETLHIIL